MVAEMSANHNGSLERATEIIRAAADAGADAVKLQTYTPGTITIKSDNEEFIVHGGLWDGRRLYDLYQEAQTPWEWTPQLIGLANELGVDCFSTPFDMTAVDFLEDCGVSRYKIASFEVVDIPLLKRVARTGKPVIMSTGMATLAEIDEAVKTLRENGGGPLTLLKCASAYPAPPEEMNLRTIPHLAETFNCEAGLSDHTMGSAVAVASVACGASLIEKHFTLSRSDGGVDSAFSIEPEEFKRLVEDVRTVEKALGKIDYSLTEKQQENAAFRRSLYIVRDVAEGEALTAGNMRSIRPGFGLHPRYYEELLGKKAKRNLKAGTRLDWKDIA